MTLRGWRFARLRRQIWFRAALMSLFAVAVAATAGIFARRIPYEFTGDVGQGSIGTVLGIMASSMLAVTTFSLTAMVGAYASATQSATPRATQLLVGDPSAQNALSTFLGAFIFSMVGIVGLQTHIYGGQGRVVLLIATILVIVVVVVTLLRWIDHLTGFGRMADVIDRVEKAASTAMTAFARDPHGGGRPAVPVPDAAAPIHAGTIGYVTHVDVEMLGRCAARHGIEVHVAALAGTLVHPGRPLARVVGPVDADVRAALAAAFTIERHRSFDHDPRHGIIALNEIGSRALSAAINDPGTAIEVLNALLRTLALLPAHAGPPASDAPAVFVPRPTLATLLDDAFLPFVRDGAGQGEVALRTTKTLAALAAMVPDAAAPLRVLAGRLGARVEAVMDDPAERARFRAVHAACWSDPADPANALVTPRC